MSAKLVVDASVAMTWLFVDEATPATEDLLSRLETESALVPAWWHIEITNVIAIAERKGRITPTQTEGFLTRLDRLDLEIDGEAASRAFTHLLPLCRTHQLTSYDAMYLDLAMRRGMPLATLDDALRKAAKKVGVEVLGR